jgi:hypothetical protein
MVDDCAAGKRNKPRNLLVAAADPLEKHGPRHSGGRILVALGQVSDGMVDREHQVLVDVVFGKEIVNSVDVL